MVWYQGLMPMEVILYKLREETGGGCAENGGLFPQPVRMPSFFATQSLALEKRCPPMTCA